MTILSAQSIRYLCVPDQNRTLLNPNLNHALNNIHPHPLITPFSERGTQSGKSYGLSACTYDCRIAEDDLTLEPMPFHLIADFMRDFHERSWADVIIASNNLHAQVGSWRALASTIERFHFPDNICGSVLDKSSYARVFVSAFNTHFDPGFRGHATIELVNLGTTPVTYRRGDPVCQFKFEWLDAPTTLPYAGKYQDQPPGPQPARPEPAP